MSLFHPPLTYYKLLLGLHKIWHTMGFLGLNIMLTVDVPLRCYSCPDAECKCNVHNDILGMTSSKGKRYYKGSV